MPLGPQLIGKTVKRLQDLTGPSYAYILYDVHTYNNEIHLCVI